MRFSAEGIRDFVRRHPLAFDIRRVDALWLLDILLSGLHVDDGRSRPRWAHYGSAGPRQVRTAELTEDDLRY